jgi:hypothetical protein
MEKILDYRDSNSDPSVVPPVASRHTDCAIPAYFTLLLVRNIIVLRYTVILKFYHCVIMGRAIGVVLCTISVLGLPIYLWQHSAAHITYPIAEPRVNTKVVTLKV